MFATQAAGKQQSYSSAERNASSCNENNFSDAKISFQHGFTFILHDERDIQSYSVRPRRGTWRSLLDNKAVYDASITGVSLGKLHSHFMLRLAGDGAAQRNALIVHNGLNF